MNWTTCDSQRTSALESIDIYRALLNTVFLEETQVRRELGALCQSTATFRLALDLFDDFRHCGRIGLLKAAGSFRLIFYVCDEEGRWVR